MKKKYKIGNVGIPYTEEIIPVSNLAFYADNPRIYSQFLDTSQRSQAEIQEKLEAMPSVQILKEQIEEDEQVNEPLWCTKVTKEDLGLFPEYGYVVLEGNSRLAVAKTRKKNKRPLIAEVPCSILNFEGFSKKDRDSFIVKLLSRFHVTGKSRWLPYEVGGYIYRRRTTNNVSAQQLAIETGKKISDVNYHLEAFNLMLIHKGALRDWSYYYEYAKIPKRHRKDNSKLDKIVLPINSSDFGSAQTMRDGLKAILRNPFIKAEYLQGNITFHTARRIADERRKPGETLAELKIFQNWIVEPDTKKQINTLQSDPETKNETELTLKQIFAEINRLLPGMKKTTSFLAKKT